MIGWLLLLPLINLPVPFPAELAPAEMELSAEIGIEELKAHVYRLASSEFLGRRGPGGARAARHIAALLRHLKLEPAFHGSFFQMIPSHFKEGPEEKSGAQTFMGSNVAAVLSGSDPKLRDEWIILSAHFDHLGVKNGRIYPGADDNASGVAMLLEVAERLVLSKDRPRRTIMFVSFDLEEAGLLGSRHFVLNPPRPLDKLKAFLTADMLGRSMANLMDEYVFTLGSETSPRLRQLLDTTPPPKGLKVGRIGADLIGTRSDYGPFRDRKIPFLFFSTGQHPDYHQPTDLPDRVDYHRLQKICNHIHDLVVRLANDAESPTWDDKMPPDLDEVRTILTLLGRMLKNPDRYPLTERQRSIVGGVEQRLQGILERGQMTSSERTWLVWTTRLLLMTVF